MSFCTHVVSTKLTERFSSRLLWRLLHLYQKRMPTKFVKQYKCRLEGKYLQKLLEWDAKMKYGSHMFSTTAGSIDVSTHTHLTSWVAMSNAGWVFHYLQKLLNWKTQIEIGLEYVQHDCRIDRCQNASTLKLLSGNVGCGLNVSICNLVICVCRIHFRCIHALGCVAAIYVHKHGVSGMYDLWKRDDAVKAMGSEMKLFFHTPAAAREAALLFCNIIFLIE